MEATGLILEGGGMRGVYTAGVLDLFIEKNFYVPYVIGVSAGACNAMSYISQQFGRNRHVTVDYIRHPRYLSWRNLIRENSLFGMQLIFDEIPKKLVPFDFDAFERSKQTFVVGVTDCYSGEPAYFYKEQSQDMLSIVKASSSLPFFSPVVKIDDRPYLDGGIADPIPIRKSVGDGNRKHIIVLTRNKGYMKKPSRIKWLAKRRYPQYEGLVQSMIKRYAVYNSTLSYIEELEARGEAFVIRPTEPLQVGRMEKNQQRLQVLYEQGYHDAKASFEKLENWV